ncbi:hypothetical protein GCK72_019964 [Caenorhabditis remanei]|uniref:BED-type domain-containing protein n=1 Tax=Caenorhabditis remanei TaxID=31234 RepID=A0A6A5GDT6_CAERE|nr:hypothetical protein GCK72_019964 [Caenorhabditis remanei]KAF1753407.1 hypothetical protein GCK72_019964 [Caenorhabditis remanei]
MSSMVWSFFEKPESQVDFVPCLKCNVMLAYKGTTSGLKKHMKSKHFADYQRIMVEKGLDVSPNLDFSHSDLLLSRSFCTGQIPFEFANNPEFRLFCSSLNFDFKVPDTNKMRQAITVNACAFIKNVAAQLKNSRSYVMITDAYSHSKLHACTFFTVYIAFIDQIKLERKILLCGPVYIENESSFHIFSEVQKVIESVGLKPENCQGTVCDVDNSRENWFFEAKNIPCAGYIIHRIFEDFAESVHIVGKARHDIEKIFQIIRENEACLDLVVQFQKDYKLSVPLPTKSGQWGSLFTSLQAYVANEVYFTHIPHLKNKLLNPKIVVELPRMIELLKPLYSTLETLTAENTFCSDIVPNLLCVKEELNEEDSIPKVLAELAQQRINDYLSNDQILLAMVSDPRYAYVPNLIDPRTWQEAETLFAQQEVQTSGDSEFLVTPKTESSFINESPEKSGIAGFLKRKIKSKCIQKTLASEIIQYQALMSTNRPCHTSNPIQFWKEQQYNLPKMAMISMKNLTAMASTSLSEKLYKKCSAILGKKDPRIEKKDIDLYLIGHVIAPEVNRELLDDQSQFDFAFPVDETEPGQSNIDQLGVESTPTVADSFAQQIKSEPVEYQERPIEPVVEPVRTLESVLADTFRPRPSPEPLQTMTPAPKMFKPVEPPRTYPVPPAPSSSRPIFFKHYQL